MAQRLGAAVARAFLRLSSQRQRLPRVSALATRFCVLAMPSLDVPKRALLVGVDDSRELAAQAIPALLAGDDEAEAAFLDHCEGAGDSSWPGVGQPRPVARRLLLMAPRWDEVSAALQQGVRS